MAPNNKNLIVLFDEFGTPAFKKANDTSYFLGVSLLYESNEETKIFNDTDSIIGLSKSKPLKNDKLSSQKILDFVTELGNHDLMIFSNYIDLRNVDLINMILDYEKFGNMSRTLYREIDKERKLAHILHSQIMEGCISDMVSYYVVKNEADSYVFEPFMDNWSYPQPDRHIVSEFTSENLESKMRKLIKDDFHRNSAIAIKEKKVLSNPSSKRKRLIDALTSTISRSFFYVNDPKFNCKPLIEIKRNLKDKFMLRNVTNEMTVFINNAK